MSKNHNLGTNVLGFESYKARPPISKVQLLWSDEDAIEVGDDTGSTLKVSCPYATEEMANNLLAAAKGYSYVGFTATGAILPDDAELGDTVTLCGINAPLAQITYSFDTHNAANITAPEQRETTHEMKGSFEHELEDKLVIGRSYYGVRTTRQNGLEVVGLKTDGTETSRFVANGDVIAAYNDDGEAALYFDVEARKFRFAGEVYVTGGRLNIADNFIVDEDGNLTLNGDINLSGGSIIWGGNNPASGKISSAQAKTIISEELVSAPIIAGGRFMDIDQKSWLEMGNSESGQVGYINHYYDEYSTTDPVLVMGFADPGTSPNWILAPFFNIALDYVLSNKTMYAMGNWDFSQATVTGLT